LISNKRGTGDFSGSKVYASFHYKGNCPTQNSGLDGVNIKKAIINGENCFSSSSINSEDSLTIGYICEPGATQNDASTIKFGYPGDTGFIINGDNFIGPVTDLIDTYSWGSIGKPEYTKINLPCSEICTPNTCTESSLDYCSLKCEKSCTIDCTDNVVCTNKYDTGETKYYLKKDVTASNCGSKGVCCSTFSFDISNKIVQTSNPSVDIPDNDPSGIIDTISINSPGTVNKVYVYLNILHTWIGDLIVSLSHSGITVTIVNRPLKKSDLPSDIGCGSGNIICYISDSGISSIDSQCPPQLDGTFSPTQPLSIFNGVSKSGNWDLKVVDSESIDAGKLISWSLYLE